ncbi:MAG: helix-turn-helix domain-containing protein [Clostridia bacterium]|nr:helix-turn-helix domain-containing protein [Clostridia bacterium]
MKQHLNMWPNSLGPVEVNAFINNENELLPYEHDHTYYEFMLIERGSLIQTIDGVDTILDKNTTCILRPDVAHTVKRNGNSTVVLLNFEVDMKFIDALSNQLGIDVHNSLLKDGIVIFKSSGHNMHNYMKLLASAYSIKDLKQSQICLKNIITKLLTQLIDIHFLGNVNIDDNIVVSAILHELNNPSNFTLGIDAICRKKSYTHEHVSRLFKKANLPQPNKVLLKNKLAYACTFLKSSKMPIIKIAEICGIYTVSYFNKSFKTEYGISPSQYRKNNSIYNKLTSHDLGSHEVII